MGCPHQAICVYSFVYCRAWNIFRHSFPQEEHVCVLYNVQNVYYSHLKLMSYHLRMLTYLFKLILCRFLLSYSKNRVESFEHSRMLILYVREGALDMCSSCTALHDGGSEGSKSCLISELKQLATFPPAASWHPLAMASTRLERFGGRLLSVVVKTLLALFRFFVPQQRGSKEADRLSSIAEPLLRVSAVQLARNIRRKQVRLWLTDSRLAILYPKEQHTHVVTCTL